MAKRDFYEVLGVERNTSETGLKKTYRHPTMKYHPDHNPGDKGAEGEFKEANEIYEVLSDANKWMAYDQYGRTGVDPDMGGSAGAGFGGANFSDIFGDMLSNFFGDGGARGGPCDGARRGADLRYTLDFDLEETVRGITVTIRVPTLVDYEVCNSSGVESGTTPVVCATCGGIGQVRMQQDFFSIRQACPCCHDTGRMISDPRGSYHGQGRVEE